MGKNATSYRRILLKLSGESLLGEHPYGIDYKACLKIGKIIQKLSSQGIQMGVVIGGGNIFRGRNATDFGFDRTPADHIGMLGTCINGLALHQVLFSLGVKVRVMSSRNIDGIIEPYNWHQALLALEKNIVMIFVGGTGNPYFTTDSAAALKASEMEAEVLIKATTVDGVYDQDPNKHKHAKRFDQLSYKQVLEMNLGVMDAAAIALCRDNNVDIRVVDLFSEDDLCKAILEKTGGTLITHGKKE